MTTMIRVRTQTKIIRCAKSLNRGGTGVVRVGGTFSVVRTALTIVIHAYLHTYLQLRVKNSTEPYVMISVCSVFAVLNRAYAGRT